jgi:hypothetical protein
VRRIGGPASACASGVHPFEQELVIGVALQLVPERLGRHRRPPVLTPERVLHHNTWERCGDTASSNAETTVSLLRIVVKVSAVLPLLMKNQPNCLANAVTLTDGTHWCDRAKRGIFTRSARQVAGFLESDRSQMEPTRSSRGHVTRLAVSSWPHRDLSAVTKRPTGLSPLAVW